VYRILINFHAWIYLLLSIFKRFALLIKWYLCVLFCVQMVISDSRAFCQATLKISSLSTFVIIVKIFTLSTRFYERWRRFLCYNKRLLFFVLFYLQKPFFYLITLFNNFFLFKKLFIFYYIQFINDAFY